MEDSSVTDFQNYHSWKPFHEESLESLEHDPEADEDQEPSLAGSVRHSSDPGEAVFDIPSHRSSPQTSPQHSDDEISVLLSDSGYPHGDRHKRQPSSPYTPLKNRSPFRNPSSVRAMQLETTPPPHLASPSSQQQQQQQQRYKLTTPSRNGTPRSVRSHHSGMRSASRLSPTKKLKKEYPLVLLHVTLLPLALSYSSEVLESVLPGYILENWKLLQEKATETVLQRGILIPHPREDYDLLEERLLESLELKLPRILKCGHFHLDPDEEAELVDLDTDAFNDDEDDDADICDDCGRRVRDGRFGSGTGSRRWDIKVYAANGLMRAGAWGAAWREMERVDVEILPWMEEDMKRELELRKEEEERHMMEQRQVQPEKTVRGGGSSKGLDDARMREIYGEEAQAYVDGLVNEEQAPLSPPPRKRHREKRRQQDVPLWTLLRNYIYLAAQDPRNVALGVLSMLVLFLSLGLLGRVAHAPLPSYSMMPMPAAGAGVPVGNGLGSRASIATAVAPTMLVSETPSAIVHDTSDPPPATTQSSSDTFSASTQSESDAPATPMQNIGESLMPDAPDEILLEMD